MAAVVPQDALELVGGFSDPTDAPRHRAELEAAIRRCELLKAGKVWRPRSLRRNGGLCDVSYVGLIDKALLTSYLCALYAIDAQARCVCVCVLEILPHTGFLTMNPFCVFGWCAIGVCAFAKGGALDEDALRAIMEADGMDNLFGAGGGRGRRGALGLDTLEEYDSEYDDDRYRHRRRGAVQGR